MFVKVFTIIVYKYDSRWEVKRKTQKGTKGEGGC